MHKRQSHSHDYWIEFVNEKRCHLQESRKMLKQILEEVEQKVKLKCCHCGKIGHVPKKLESARSVSSTNGDQPSVTESPLKYETKRTNTEEQVLFPLSQIQKVELMISRNGLPVFLHEFTQTWHTKLRATIAWIQASVTHKITNDLFRSGKFSKNHVRRPNK